MKVKEIDTIQQYMILRVKSVTEETMLVKLIDSDITYTPRAILR
jgi:hypothetical protein